MDPKVKNKRYKSCDELVDNLKPYFVGQIGMRIMQRPQGKAKYKTKEDLKKFMTIPRNTMRQIFTVDLRLLKFVEL